MEASRKLQFKTIFLTSYLLSANCSGRLRDRQRSTTELRTLAALAVCRKRQAIGMVVLYLRKYFAQYSFRIVSAADDSRDNHIR